MKFDKILKKLLLFFQKKQKVAKKNQKDKVKLDNIIIQPVDKETKKTDKVKQPKQIKYNFNKFIANLKVKIDKRINKIKKWYAPQKEFKAFFTLLFQIALDGLLISVPYWYFVNYNILTIPVFGTALIVIKKQIVPVIVQIIGSFSLIRITK
jgi:hypothetical protein